MHGQEFCSFAQESKIFEYSEDDFIHTVCAKEFQESNLSTVSVSILYLYSYQVIGTPFLQKKNIELQYHKLLFITFSFAIIIMIMSSRVCILLTFVFLDTEYTFSA